MALKGVVLAGGTASRMFPLTRVTNKHLLPVGKVPMIYWPIARLVEGGITEIAIVTGRDHMGDIVNLLGSGYELGVSFTYRVQDRPGGIAQALGLAEGFVGDDGCVVLLGDNVFVSPIAGSIASFAASPGGARIILKEVSDPERFGVATLSDDGATIAKITEKPDAPDSNLAVTGAYMYDACVFEVIRTLKPSGRGELEITDVNNHYVNLGEIQWSLYEGQWTDAGTFDSFLRANELAHASPVPEVLSPILSK